ncbi:hypothetical protein Taro_044299 [Colocasia esculenta]|uniref:PsbP C-terminal domain-containing protein n=1 Tax=Colocasia esculenta TaxID=4460 RepID=A0A843WLI9_COLES|nr:hypothetical protein [Colocasia esculenta]
MATASVTPVSPLFSTSARSLPPPSPASPSPPRSSLSFKPSSKEPQQLAVSSEQQEAHWGCRRRDLLAAAALTPFLLPEPPRSGAREVEVGSYLPPDPSNPSFVVFKASPQDTPALRAGNVQPYEFILPPSWKQTRVANILSGNYCQPKCAEPWVEVKFEDDKQGKIQVVVSPLIRLTNKPNATIEEIGNPEKVIASLGPFVTGNTLDPDELLEASIKKQGDQTVFLHQWHIGVEGN